MERREFTGFGGVRLIADVFGSPENPTVLLIPSAGQVREFWHGSAEALADAGRYAICIDMRGHGDSEHAPEGRYDLDSYAADLKTILSSLPSRAFVVGAGLGALAAIAAVGESAPHLVSGMALVDTNLWTDPAVMQRLQEALRLRARRFSDPVGIMDAIATIHPGEPRPAPTPRILAAFTAKADGSFAWRGDPRVLENDRPFDEQERLTAAAAGIVAPVLLMRGALNETVTAETTRRLRDLIPGSEIAEIEGAGHYASAESEDSFNSLLLEFLERRAPRQANALIGGSEPRLLRDALGCFATGVTVVTTISADGEPIGLTANSFTSVSLDPPLILFSLAKSSANLATFVAAKHFAINVLHIGQQPVGGRFAQRGVARFEGVDWAVRIDGGSPILAASLASFDCRTYAVHDGGDHLIFIGEVTHAWFEPDRDPLLYFRGKFRRLHFA